MKLRQALILLIVFFLGFSQAYGAKVRIISPKGGEEWKQGSTINIEWEFTGKKTPVTIFLFRGDKKVGVIAKNIPVERGKYTWKVGAFRKGTVRSAKGYSIRIMTQKGKVLARSHRSFRIIDKEALSIHEPIKPVLVYSPRRITTEKLTASGISSDFYPINITTESLTATGMLVEFTPFTLTTETLTATGLLDSHTPVEITTETLTATGKKDE